MNQREEGWIDSVANRQVWVMEIYRQTCTQLYIITETISKTRFGRDTVWIDKTSISVLKSYKKTLANHGVPETPTTSEHPISTAKKITREPHAISFSVKTVKATNYQTLDPNKQTNMLVAVIFLINQICTKMQHDSGFLYISNVPKYLTSVLYFVNYSIDKHVVRSADNNKLDYMSGRQC